VKSESDVLLNLYAAAARDKVVGDTLEAKCKAAMRYMQQRDTMFMGGDEDLAFRSALGAVLIVLDKDSDEAAVLRESIEALGAVNAMLNAARFGVSVGLPDLNPERIVPLTGWWHQVRAGG